MFCSFGMVTVPLHEVASVRMGLTLRGREATRPDPAGTCWLVQIGDIDDDGGLSDAALLPFTPGVAVKEGHFLKPGDVLVPNRGTRCVAVVFDRPERTVLAGSQFLIVRPEGGRLVSAFLAWYLSSPSATAHLNEFRCGSVVPTLPRGALESLVIPLPSLAKQSAVAALHALAVREQALRAEIGRLRATLVQQQLLSTLTTP